MHQYLLIFFPSLIVSALMMLALRRWALRSRMLVSGDVALVGGIAIGVSLVVSSGLGLAVSGVNPGRIIGTLTVSLLMLVCGVMDDLKEASVAKKFLLQSAGALLLILIDVRTHIIYLNDWGNCLVSFLWIVGITNAFNLLDVIDGLSAGVALTVTGALFVLAVLYPDIHIQILTLGLGAAILGFWYFNLPPARAYLGNAGSHFLGFLLAALTLMSSFAGRDEPMALLSPIILLGLPLLETAALICFRVSKRMIPFNKSNDHMALRLIALGFSRRRALFILLGVSLFFAACGVVLTRCDGPAVFYPAAAVLLTGFILLKVLMRAECHDR